jgi:hypothetical protein
MENRIKDLGAFLRAGRDSNRKFVLMLGAGASIASGVKSTPTIMQELVERYASADRQPGEDSIPERFDQLWRGESKASRQTMLAPYLEVRPSSGYEHLARLIKSGFIDVIVTFNFDRLLEQALDAEGFRDYRVIIRGETEVDAISTLLANERPRVKILKLHGSLDSADYFLFSQQEMLNYPPPIADVFGDLTARELIVCGYAFNDNCVIRAFSHSADGGSIYCVDPAGSPNALKGFMAARRSQGRVISGEWGRFDAFFPQLCASLDALERPPEDQPKRNLFKFMDHFQENHREWFFGREPLTEKLGARLAAPELKSFILYGKSRVGKTSLVRAGLIPHLKNAGCNGIYVRCKSDLDATLREVADSHGVQGPQELARILAELKQRFEGVRTVLVLDQFERITRVLADAPSETTTKGLDALRSLLEHCDDRFCVVFVSVREERLWQVFYVTLKTMVETEEVVPLEPQCVASILQQSARLGGTTLDAKVVDMVVRNYADSLRSAKHGEFTLTHVQTLCYYLIRGSARQWDGRGSPASMVAALESAKDNSLTLIELIDDLPGEERGILRTVLKIVCDPDRDNQSLIKLLRDRFPDVRKDEFPEAVP